MSNEGDYLLVKKQNIKQEFVVEDEIIMQNENKNILIDNNTNGSKDYETFNKNENNNFNNNKSNESKQEISIEINNNTTVFDLYKGLFYMFLSCVFKSIFSILSKLCLKTKKDMSSFQLMSYRTYFMLWITIIVALLSPVKVFSEEFVKRGKLLGILIRTVFAIISMSLVIYSIKYMHISDVYSVYYIYPAFVILMGFFHLKEKITILDIGCLLSCFIGAILIVKPDFIFKSNAIDIKEQNTNSNGFYFFLVVIAAVLKTIEDIIIRDTGKDGAHFLIVPMMYSVLGIVLFPIPMILYDTHYPSFSFYEVCMLFLVAASTFLYQAFMALGLQNESAGRVSLVNYFQVAFMYLTDLFVFDKALNYLDLIGTSMIFGFNVANGIYKTMKRFKELNKYNIKNNLNNAKTV
jgi:drug/metabolite transporter (DMT)-like permease